MLYNRSVFTEGVRFMGYNFKDIEKKWQNKWYSEGTFYAKDDPSLKNGMD